MTKADAKKIAQEYLNQHKDRYKTVAKKDIKQAVERVAKALEELGPKAIKDPPSTKARGAKA